MPTSAQHFRPSLSCCDATRFTYTAEISHERPASQRNDVCLTAKPSMKPLASTKLHQAAGAARRVRILVKEAGSSRLNSGGADGFDETIVIAQMRGESPLRFAARAVERITALGRSGRRISAATLQTGERHDPATNVARRSILVALLGQGIGRGGAMSEVLLEAPCDARGAGSAELLALADELLQLPECDALPVRLRFQGTVEPSPEVDSGVFWRVPSPPSAD